MPALLHVHSAVTCGQQKMPFFGYGERFKEAKEHTPGPGDYDPSKARGFKVDPRSGFVGKDRFSESEREEGMSPDLLSLLTSWLGRRPAANGQEPSALQSVCNLQANA